MYKRGFRDKFNEICVGFIQFTFFVQMTYVLRFNYYELHTMDENMYNDFLIGKW